MMSCLIFVVCIALLETHPSYLINSERDSEIVGPISVLQADLHIRVITMPIVSIPARTIIEKLGRAYGSFLGYSSSYLILFR